MNREGEALILREHLETVDHLVGSLDRVQGRIASLVPFTPERTRALAGDDHIYVLAFLKTFEQLEEALGRTLKTVVMLMHLGEVLRLTPRDVAFRAASLGIIPDAKAWADAVRVRNALAHEYPLDPAKQAGQVNAAWHMRETLIETGRSIHDFVERERLLHGDL
ncbi:hypothetical protein OKW76_13745 [Sphingomonas sp. S1-29]|uniref:hypothetical protein n=1 Tax=Sphingomonas sp. S1-29 TaxID=2991074 RepID=UPI00223ECE8C|nr:hypothetical protein [Sphingomonas sp. S1-29]UZK69075.1 hypothetical protein OKW76_13745 [Sphingomonas sp. S1-29]